MDLVERMRKEVEKAHSKFVNANPFEKEFLREEYRKKLLQYSRQVNWVTALDSKE